MNIKITPDNKNFVKLKTIIKKTKYSNRMDDSLANKGDPKYFLPILNFSLLHYSPLVADFLLHNNYELFSKNDKEFVKLVILAMINLFDYKPCISVEEFFKIGFSERKSEMCWNIFEKVMKKHEQMAKNNKLMTKGIKKNNQLNEKLYDQVNTFGGTNENENENQLEDFNNNNEFKEIEYENQNQYHNQYNNDYNNQINEDLLDINQEDEEPRSRELNNETNHFSTKKLFKNNDNPYLNNINNELEYDNSINNYSKNFQTNYNNKNSINKNNNFNDINENQNALFLKNNQIINNHKVKNRNNSSVDEDFNFLDKYSKNYNEEKNQDWEKQRHTKKNPNFQSNQDNPFQQQNINELVEIITNLAFSVKEMTGRVDEFKQNIEKKMSNIENEVKEIKQNFNNLQAENVFLKNEIIILRNKLTTGNTKEKLFEARFNGGNKNSSNLNISNEISSNIIESNLVEDEFNYNYGASSINSKSFKNKY